MKLYRPQKIYIDAEAESAPRTADILSRLPGVPSEVIHDIRPLIDQVKKEPDPVGYGKRFLYLAHDKGRSFKPFPESEQYLSCDYYTLHLEEGCDLECSYCILQSYLTNPLITVYVNLDESLSRLESTLTSNSNKFFRIGTGQLADSLALDPITRYSEILVPFFARQTNAILELKTKSHFVDALLDLDPKGRTIVSWSMNSRKIQREEEHKCASLEERIEAAQKVTAAGYRAGFHLDPIIDYPGWEKDYEETIRMIFSSIKSESIAWISLGCLRMMKELKPIMASRFPKSGLPAAEWIHGMDGKLRYFKPRRIEIYRKVAAMIRRHSKDLTLYLSMETPEVWEKVFGQRASKESVCAMLDSAAKKRP